MKELKEIRLKKNVSKNEVIRKTKLTRHLVTAIERGGNVGVNHLLEYCKFLGIKIIFES